MNNTNSSPASQETTENPVIHFSEGVLGFEDVKDYLLYHEDENNMIWSLQAAYDSYPSFIVVDPFTIVSDYSPLLSKEDCDYFGETNMKNLCFLVIAAIKQELTESVCNLKAPIVINVNTRKAKQIIMDDSEYPIRYKLFANQK